MVTRPFARLSRFRRSESGVTLIEGLIVFPLMLTVIITFVEFGYAVFQWEQTGRAIAIGARVAAVSDPVAQETDFKTLGSYSAGLPGDPVGGDTVRVSCVGDGATAGLAKCTQDFNRILYGSDGICKTAYGGALPGMCDVNPRIKAENVIVTYTRNGLGYIGRDAGPVVNVTVQLRNLNFSTFLLGPLLGIRSIPIPFSPVTVTGEDLSTCNNPARSATTFSNPCPTL
ncbi:pilus assembly protein TadE [Gemmobacter aquarius]|uniref:Pilus assembly protein TadE n=1 Tax=Paragemmobacter aquarius TaxID=2169400 RepID=A0A2S0UNZ6_9RHOB|nr:TadE/TadG family type IV pilus assembly protein [Gemmobacter aquarius]AWB49510.1 pilus assembly protein TadE [Gemmobacter aquarius]